MLQLPGSYGSATFGVFVTQKGNCGKLSSWILGAIRFSLKCTQHISPRRRTSQCSEELNRQGSALTPLGIVLPALLQKPVGEFFWGFLRGNFGGNFGGNFAGFF